MAGIRTHTFIHRTKHLLAQSHNCPTTMLHYLNVAAFSYKRFGQNDQPSYDLSSYKIRVMLIIYLNNCKCQPTTVNVLTQSGLKWLKDRVKSKSIENALRET